MLSRLCCVIGLHAWYYGEDHAYARMKDGRRPLFVRICTRCPAKQRYVLVHEGREKRWVIVS